MSISEKIRVIHLCPPPPPPQSKCRTQALASLHESFIHFLTELQIAGDMINKARCSIFLLSQQIKIVSWKTQQFRYVSQFSQLISGDVCRASELLLKLWRSLLNGSQLSNFKRFLTSRKSFTKSPIFIHVHRKQKWKILTVFQKAHNDFYN